MKRIYIFILLLIGVVVILNSCTPKPQVDGSYDFIIYESDADNTNLSDNVVVARYKIEYSACKTVTDTLIPKDGKYYFSNNSKDYLVLEDSGYGLTYKTGYFENFSQCANNKEIDVSWSYTAINGEMASVGISETPLEGLYEYGFVINGWK